MTKQNEDQNMNREKLENRINDAADGLLGQNELSQLENELENHPELAEQYRQIMRLPDLSKLYGEQKHFRSGAGVAKILKTIENEEIQNLPFETITLHLFKKYALAASLLILTGISLFNIMQPDIFSDDIVLDEIYYPVEESLADEYVLFLENWIEP